VVASALLSLGLVALLVLVVAALGRDGGVAQALPTAGSATSTPSGAAGGALSGIRTGTSTDVLSDARSDPRTDVEAPRSRPVQLLNVLADARATAWREAAAERLAEADAPGSVAAARDTAAVAELARAGVRYTGLRYRVAEATTVSTTPGTAVLRARIDTGRYTMTGPTGSTPRAAVPGGAVLVDLVLTGDGWRMSDVRALP